MSKQWHGGHAGTGAPQEEREEPWVGILGRLCFQTEFFVRETGTLPKVLKEGRTAPEPASPEVLLHTVPRLASSFPHLDALLFHLLNRNRPSSPPEVPRPSDVPHF